MDDAVIIDGWYRLAAAVVKGLPADDPELLHWREAGHRIRERMDGRPATAIGSARPGHMNTVWTEADGRSRPRGSRRNSARISAKTAARS